MRINEHVLATLVEERRREIARDVRLARRFRLRRRLAALGYRLAALVRAVAARNDEPCDAPAEEAGTVPA